MANIPLILAPGLMCDAALFNRQIEHFEASRAVSVAEFTNQNSIGTMASDLLDVAPPTFLIAGLSMGGIVALEVYRQAADRVAGMVLMNTTPYPDTPEKQANRRRQIAQVADGRLEEVVLSELKPNYLAEQSKADLVLQNEIAEMARRLGEGVFTRQSHALMTRPDGRIGLSEITCPVSLIAGDQDILCPPGIHFEMQGAILNSTIQVLPDCGHLSTMEQPDAVNALIEKLIVKVEEERKAA